MALEQVAAIVSREFIEVASPLEDFVESKPPLYARCRLARQPTDQPAPSNNGHPFLDAGVRSLYVRGVSLLPGTGGSFTHVPIS